MFLRKVASAFFALGIVSAASSAQSQNALDAITSSKQVRIGVPLDFPPYGSVGTDLSPQGIDIDVANLIATKLGAKPTLVPVITANRIPYLQTNKVELIVATLAKNAERAKVIDFSVPYGPFYQGVFASPGVKIGNYSDLSGKTVGVTRGGLEDLALHKLAPKDTLYRRYEDHNTLASAFLSGQTDIIALGGAAAFDLKARNPDKPIELKIVIQKTLMRVGVAKGQTALLARVNEIITEARADGSLDAIFQKWLGEGIGKDLDRE